MFKFLIYKFGQFWVNHLPLSWSYYIAMRMSDMHYRLSFRDRQAVRENLLLVVGETRDLERKVREVFHNFARYLVEFFRTSCKVDKKFIEEKVRMENLDRLDEALRNNKGVILLTGHLGNWELGGVILSVLGYPLVAIALPHKERPVNDLFNKQREIKGVTVVPARRDAVRRCIGALKENKIVAILADRDFGGNGEVFSFLGQQKRLPRGAAIFSAKTGACILPTFLIRRDDGSFKLIFEKPIYPREVQAEQIDQRLVRDIINSYKGILEEKIRQYPTQWLMFRRFWEE